MASCIKIVIVMMDNSYAQGASLGNARFLTPCGRGDFLANYVKVSVKHHCRDHTQAEIWNTKTAQRIEETVNVDAVESFFQSSAERRI